MSEDWERVLARWRDAGLIDDSSHARIRAWEARRPPEQPPATHRLAALAFGLGALLLVAGVLLFVSSHWDELGAAARFALVLALVGLFHAGGAAATARSPHLARSLHAAGTGALGAGIFLCGQIFHLAEHWPAALLLWSLGAAAAWGLLRDWPQLLWLALLVPAWLVGEWAEHVGLLRVGRYALLAPLAGVWLLAWTYLSAPKPRRESPSRRALAYLGGALLIPAGSTLAFLGEWAAETGGATPGLFDIVLPWVLALALPFSLAAVLRGRLALWLLAPLGWALAVGALAGHGDGVDLLRQCLCALAAVGAVAWGVAQRQPGTVNLGVAAFSLVLVWFYFSSLFDKLGRSLGLIGIGLLFLGGGWLLERTRRSLVARIGRAAP